MTTELKIYRETALPATLENDSIYFVTNSTNSDLIECYVTNSSGTVRRLINEADVEALIATEIANASNLSIVADIPARDALEPTSTVSVYVEDASDDTTVDSGGAYYIYNTSSSSWIKTAEAESMDVSLNWTDIQGGPTSTPAQIDAAVSNSHTHANKTQLDKVGENSNGNLTYDGNLPYTGWETTNW